ncbi:MAG TPA: hypothetical protein VFK52_08905 [Nocardioidaceae bacterium]|nr:hypothetical protein [Nocardioidaceae bacterium]
MAGLILSACGAESDLAAHEAAAFSSLPEGVTSALLSDSLRVEGTEFSDAEITPASAIEALNKVYDLGKFEQQPVAYSVRIQSSPEMRLPPGREVWMLHIPDVPREVAPPALPDRSDREKGEIVLLDMFAFVDAKTGEHIATIYIASGRQ